MTPSMERDAEQYRLGWEAGQASIIAQVQGVLNPGHSVHPLSGKCVLIAEVQEALTRFQRVAPEFPDWEGGNAAEAAEYLADLAPVLPYYRATAPQFWHDSEYHYRMCFDNACVEATPPPGESVKTRFGVVVVGDVDRVCQQCGAAGAACETWAERHAPETQCCEVCDHDA